MFWLIRFVFGLVMAFLIVFFFLKLIGIDLTPAGPFAHQNLTESFIDRAADWIKGLLPLDKETQAQKTLANSYLDAASKKFDEYKALVEAGKAEEAKSVLKEYQELMNQALTTVSQIDGSKSTATGLAQKAKDMAEANLEYVKAQSDLINPDIKKGWSVVVDGVEQAAAELRKRLGW